MLPQAQTPSPHRRSLAQELGHAPQTASSADGSHINQPLLPTPSFLSARGYAVVARVAASAQNVISKVVETKSQQLFVCKSLSLQLGLLKTQCQPRDATYSLLSYAKPIHCYSPRRWFS